MAADRNALPQGAGGWAKALLAQPLPALARTATDIAACAEDDASSTAELAALILRDAGMTAKVLRLASSRLYNPHALRIRTVSRAVALLGFNVVREIALGIAVLDAFGGRQARCAQAAAEAAHALRAAVQARGLAELAELPEAEEVFIAALLQGLGGLALWSAAPDLLPDLASAAAESPVLARERVRTRLEVDLADLSLLLNAELRLSPLLLAEDDPPGKAAARFAHRWVDALSPGGDPADFELALAEAATRFGLPSAALRDSVIAHARQSDALVEQLFDPAARALLPATRPVAAGAPASPPGGGQTLPGTRLDPMLGLEVLRDLSELLAAGRPDPGVALSMVMEGLQRAAGLERVVFALLSPDRRELRLRSALARQRETLAAAFPLPLGDDGRLLEALAQPRFLHLDGEGGVDGSRLLARLGAQSALLGPLVVEGRAIGLLYADRAESGEAIDGETQILFGLLTQQANLALAMAR